MQGMTESKQSSHELPLKHISSRTGSTIRTISLRISSSHIKLLIFLPIPTYLNSPLGSLLVNKTTKLDSHLLPSHKTASLILQQLSPPTTNHHYHPSSSTNMVITKIPEGGACPELLELYLKELFKDDDWKVSHRYTREFIIDTPKPFDIKHFLGDGWRAKKRHASSNYKKESGQELKIKEKICQEINSKLKRLSEKGQIGHGEEVKEEVKGEEVKGDETKGEETKGEEVKGEEAKGQEVKGQEVKGIEDAEAINTPKGEGEK
ncbi:hypothetical protein F5Y08DRAFT_11909 [Xylaria arbuscula]|nr:hypothetical protein F5Y08DRAFT_11909 [Xylaria arbuscula]